MRQALVVIFNQDWSCNVPALERLHGARFERRAYLVPDHASRFAPWYVDPRRSALAGFVADCGYNRVRRVLGRRNAHELEPGAAHACGGRRLRVVGHQYQFHHFICQAWRGLRAMDADWYWFVGDDVLPAAWFDAARAFERLGAAPGTDCVLCRPQAKDDGWVRHFNGGAATIGRVLDRCLPRERLAVLDARYRELCGVSLDRAALGGCSDFFGVSRALLARAVPVWRALFRRHLFVEMAVPNALLALAERPHHVERYLWEFGDGRERWRALAGRLFRDPGLAFAHPVKLSGLDAAEAAALARGEIPLRRAAGTCG